VDATGCHKVTDLFKRVDADVLRKVLTIVVIQIGVNDASANVTLEAFKAQLEELIGKLQQGGAPRCSNAPAPAGSRSTTSRMTRGWTGSST
jgi:lysophospholipase L1-like esterase